MAKRLKEWTRQRRPWILAAGAVLALGLLAAAVFAVYWWNARSDHGGKETIPVLVDTPIAG
jgi:ABC-type sulfate transport system permease component